MASFEISSKLLRSNLSSSTKFVSSKSDRRDSTKCVKFVAGLDSLGDFLELRSTNLDVEFTKIIRETVMVHAYGEFVVNGTIMLDYIKSVEDDVILITVNDEGKVVICEQGSVMEVSTGELEDFPEFSTNENENSITVDSSTFYTCLTQASFATATEGHGRYGAIDAVCLDFTPGNLAFSGTDTQRASLIQVETEHTTDCQYLVSSKACQSLKGILNDTINLVTEDRYLSIKGSDYSIVLRRINGHYPDVRGLLPDSDYTNGFVVIAGVLLKAALKTKLALSNQSPLIVGVSENLLTLKGSDDSSAHRRAKVDIPIAYSRDPVEFSVNCDHLTSLLKVLDPSSEITINFEYNGSTLLFRQGNLVHLLRKMEV